MPPETLISTRGLTRERPTVPPDAKSRPVQLGGCRCRIVRRFVLAWSVELDIDVYPDSPKG